MAVPALLARRRPRFPRLLTTALPFLLVMLGVGGGPASASPLFSAPFLSFPTADHPQSLAVGDLNGDGRPDLTVGSFQGTSPLLTGTVSVLLGNGDGTFGPRVDRGFGTATLTADIGDLNRDGKGDLAVTLYDSATVAILLGNGDGTFVRKADLHVGYGPVCVAIRDLNRDGLLDVVAVDVGSFAVSVLLGNGDGTFGPRADYASGESPECLAIGDLNGDGIPDLVVGNVGSYPYYAGSVSVLLGRGDGSFAKRTDYAILGQAVSVAVGDLNRDGIADVAVADAYQQASNWSAVSVFFGRGDGTLGARNDYPINATPTSVAIGDLNADGKPDIAATSVERSTASVLLGHGDGSFGDPVEYGIGAYASSLVIADLNLDGRPDLAATANQNTVSVALGNGDGTFGTRHEFGTGSNPGSAAVADLNGDGTLDLAVPDYGSASVSVLLGDGHGAFGARTDFSTGGSPLSVAVGDLNGDGRPDLATVNGSRSGTVLLGNGDGTFSPRSNAGVIGGNAVAIGDLNGDGRRDLVVAGRRVSLLPGNGDGTFGAAIDWATVADVQSMVVADLNGDGKLDVVTANPGTDINPVNAVSVMLGSGTGTCSSWREYATGICPSGVAVGDLNGDGKPDLAVANADRPQQYGNSVSVLLNNGDGTFRPRTDYPTGWYSTSVAIGDLNGDGCPDLAVANTDAHMISVLPGRCDGTFGAMTGFGAGSYPRFVAIARWNEDAAPDLAVVNSGSNSVSILLNAADLPTAVALSLQSSAATWEYASLVWGVAGAGGLDATVYRRTAPTAWRAVGTVAPDGAGRMVFVDRDVTPGMRYGYRLGIVESARETYYGETWLTIPVRAEFALRGLQPNPAGARVAVAFSLPDDRPALFELFDVRGRRLLARELGALGAGTHVLALDEGARLPAGVYLMRLTREGRALTARGAIVR